MAREAAALPAPLVTFVRRRTVAKVDSIVIWSRPKGVLHVVQEAVSPAGLRGGCGYLPPSMTQILRRNSAGPTRALTRLAA
jgi:hypothetical protein